jgi:uncharacterized protein (DUF1501 family)
MKRRSFLSMSAAAGATLSLRSAFGVQAPTARAWSSCGSHNLLILVELKGGNDGLNTVIPFADPAYYNLRKNICIKREHAIALDERTALHPSLLPLMPLWRNRQLAVVQGVGYAQPNLSHFRSTEIWDTASRSDQYLREGWLTRAFAQMRGDRQCRDGAVRERRTCDRAGRFDATRQRIAPRKSRAAARAQCRRVADFRRR